MEILMHIAIQQGIAIYPVFKKGLFYPFFIKFKGLPTIIAGHCFRAKFIGFRPEEDGISYCLRYVNKGFSIQVWYFQ